MFNVEKARRMPNLPILLFDSADYWADDLRGDIAQFAELSRTFSTDLFMGVDRWILKVTDASVCTIGGQVAQTFIK